MAARETTAVQEAAVACETMAVREATAVREAAAAVVGEGTR
jgi:hypothetical protein